MTRLFKRLRNSQKQFFNIDQLLLSANELKFTKAIKTFISEQLLNPSEDFMQFVLKNIYLGRITVQVKEQFTPILKRASIQLINDKVNDRLKNALASTESTADLNHMDSLNMEKEEEKVITTEEEKEGFYIIKAILSEIIDLERIVYRDTQSYFGILIDNNNRKPIARLYLNGNKKYLAVLDLEKKEEKLPLSRIDDLFNYRDKIITSCKNYLD